MVKMVPEAVSDCQENVAGTEALAQRGTKVDQARQVPSVLRASEEHLARTGAMVSKALRADPV